MNSTEWIAVASALGTGLGTGIALAVRLIVAVLRELVNGQKDQTSALTEMKLELVALRTRVDTLIEVRRDSVQTIDMTPVPFAQRKPRPR